MAGKLQIGLVGCRRGRGLARVFAAHPSAQVAALCDIDESTLETVGQAFNLPDSARFTNYDEMLNAPLDAVIIATPIALHAEHTIKALETGRHVLCEQTMAYTVEDCQRVVNAVEKTGRVYMMGENYCYFHYVRCWQKAVAEGKLGSIYYAEGEYIHEIIHLLVNKQTGEFYWRHSRPPIWYCAHTLGPLLLLMDDRIVQACGLTTGFTKLPEYKDHLGFLDFELGLFKTRKGAVIKILRSQVASRPHMVWYALYGTKGHLENSRLDKWSHNGVAYEEGAPKSECRPVEFPVADPQAPAVALGGHGTSEYYMMRDFLNAVEHGSRPPIDVIRACDMTIPGLFAHESAMKGGQWLDVPLLG